MQFDERIKGTRQENLMSHESYTNDYILYIRTVATIAIMGKFDESSSYIIPNYNASKLLLSYN